MQSISEEQVLKDLKLPCVVKVYADWCKPCHKIEPEFVKLYETYKEHFTFYKANVDVCKDFADEFDIKSIPVLMILTENKQLITHKIDELKEKIGNYIKK